MSTEAERKKWRENRKKNRDIAKRKKSKVQKSADGEFGLPKIDNIYGLTLKDFGIR